MHRLCTFLLTTGLLGLIAACTLDAEVHSAEVPGMVQPANFPAPVYSLTQNAPSRAAFELGRQLFYDPLLSRDGSISCGSCHQQSKAFTDGRAFSVGIGHQAGTRNAPVLQNLRWRRELMWDGAVSNIEVLPLAPLHHKAEMGETLPNVLAKLNASANYRRRFEQVYGPGPISSQQFLRALAQFMAGLTSADSRYDHYVRQETGGRLSESELRGLALYQAKCAGCHATDLFTDESYRNNGLDRSFPADSGRMRVTGRPRERGLFKVPSLRNVALTAPYMHDGRFGTLDQVLAHYAQGVVPSPTLDPLMRQSDGRLGLPLTAEQQRELEAFLMTLTDEKFITNAELAPPR